MLESIVREAYYDYMIENNLDDCSETIEMFLAAMYYEIQDDLENLYDEFHIPSELEGIQAHYFIEDKIRDILKEGV